MALIFIAIQSIALAIVISLRMLFFKIAGK